jgi:hypothetical protein
LEKFLNVTLRPVLGVEEEDDADDDEEVIDAFLWLLAVDLVTLVGLVGLVLMISLFSITVERKNLALNGICVHMLTPSVVSIKSPFFKVILQLVKKVSAPSRAG